MDALAPGTSPASTFDAFAEHYDAYTDHPLFDPWITGIEALARDRGLRGRRLLDAGCGTGRSLLPMLALGYDVVGCDASAGMLERARAKVGTRARLVCADLTDLPVLGSFDLAFCLNDVCNYLTDRAGLRAALRGIAANLAPGGLLVMDATTLAGFRTVFASTHRRVSDGRVCIWQGLAGPAFSDGELAEVVVEIFAEQPDGGWARSSALHRQRHHPDGTVRGALADAGLEVLAVLGQHNDGRRDPTADPARHFKALYLARRPVPGPRKEVSPA